MKTTHWMSWCLLKLDSFFIWPYLFFKRYNNPMWQNNRESMIAVSVQHPAIFLRNWKYLSELHWTFLTRKFVTKCLIATANIRGNSSFVYNTRSCNRASDEVDSGVNWAQNPNWTGPQGDNRRRRLQEQGTIEQCLCVNNLNRMWPISSTHCFHMVSSCLDPYRASSYGVRSRTK